MTPQQMAQMKAAKEMKEKMDQLEAQLVELKQKEMQETTGKVKAEMNSKIQLMMKELLETKQVSAHTEDPGMMDQPMILTPEDMALQASIDATWAKYDKDCSGTLDKSETFLLVKDALKDYRPGKIITNDVFE